ncbi:MAG TPA: hypothetical protein PKW15_06205, partial [Alphaproteobacteria bacterium]|nr:hypothetical protein [Alphaproteobacteria bacterium]
MFNLEFYDQYRAAERMLAGLMERNPDAAALFPQPGHDYISVAALYQVCCEFMIDPGVRAKIDRDKIERVTHRIRKQTTEDLSRSTMMYGLDFVAYPPNLFIHLKDRDNVYCSYNAWMVWSFQGLQIVKDQKPEIYE